MRWAADLEDPEIAAADEFAPLERPMHLLRRKRAAAADAAAASHQRGDETASAGPSGRGATPHEPGRGGLLPVAGRAWRRAHPAVTAGGGGWPSGTPLPPLPPPPPPPEDGRGDDGFEDDDFEDDDDDDDSPASPATDRLESAKLLAAGGIAGAVSKTATAPLARLTILYQVQGTAAAAASPLAGLSLGAAMRAVVARDGVAALWRGNGVTIGEK